MNRRDTLKALAMGGLLAVAGGRGTALAADGNNLPAGKMWWTPTPDMDVMTAMHTRRSVRSFTGDPVSPDFVRKILAAGMSAPSSRNQQSWRFVVIQKREVLDKLPVRGPGKAPLAILVCGEQKGDDLSWVPGCSACAQNMLLAAHALGLGAVWTAAFADEKRSRAYSEALHLPENIIPLCCLVMGYPATRPAPENRYDESKVHYDAW